MEKEALAPPRTEMFPALTDNGRSRAIRCVVCGCAFCECLGYAAKNVRPEKEVKEFGTCGARMELMN